MAKPSRQSLGGRARAQALSSEARREIARTAATARWTSRDDVQAEVEEGGKSPAIKLNISAGRIRNVLKTLSEAEASALLTTLWPDLSGAVARMIVRYPDEVSCSGASMTLPASWREIDKTA